LSYSIETVLLANLQDGTSPGAMGGVVSNESLEDLLNDKSPPTIGSLTNPNAPEIVDRHLIRARMLMKSGNLLPPGDNALAQFKAILKLAPGNAESLAGIETVIDHTLNEAAHALDVGQPAQAERLLSKAVKIDPDHAELAKKARRIRRDIELWKITLNPPAPDECSKNAGITKPELIESMLQNASQGKAAEVSELISAGVHTDVMDGHQDTALMLAAQNGHNEIIKILLDKGAKIDCTNSLGETALMYAVRNGHAETTSLLISRRASLHFKTKEEADGRTALFMAIENGDFAITRLLLQNGAQPDVKDNIGKTPLMIAAGLGYEPIAKLLLNQNINLDAQDGDGRTALMLAARNGRVDVLRTLLENGAEIHIEDSGGNNAIYHAMAGGHLQAAQLLQRAAEASAANLKQNNFAMEA
jgi:ankyrin repeat protein